MGKGKQDRVSLVCDCCGKTFEQTKTYSLLHEKHFCSMGCYSKWRAEQEDHGWTEEQRAAKSKQMAEMRPCSEDNYRRKFGKREHRAVAEEKLGRPLKPGEVVHHIDGDKHNNTPENLMVFASQKEHAAYHAAHPEIAAGKKVV